MWLYLSCKISISLRFLRWLSCENDQPNESALSNIQHPKVSAVTPFRNDGVITCNYYRKQLGICGRWSTWSWSFNVWIKIKENMWHKRLSMNRDRCCNFINSIHLLIWKQKMETLNNTNSTIRLKSRFRLNLKSSNCPLQGFYRVGCMCDWGELTL